MLQENRGESEISGRTKASKMRDWDYPRELKKLGGIYNEPNV